MFLETVELSTVVYQYQLEQNPYYDDYLSNVAISTAVSEVKSYLSRFDTVAIFNARDDQRNPLILSLTKTIAVWYLLQQSNIDSIHDNIKERYDRAIAFLSKIQKGDIQPDLPSIKDSNGQPNTMFSYGSNRKFSRSDEY